MNAENEVTGAEPKPQAEERRGCLETVKEARKNAGPPADRDGVRLTMIGPSDFILGDWDLVVTEEELAALTKRVCEACSTYEANLSAFDE